MSSHHRRIIFPVLMAIILSLSGCKQKAPVTQAQTPHKAPAAQAAPAEYKVYQGVQSPIDYDYKGARVCFVYGKEEHCWNAGDGFSEVTAKPIKLRSGRRLILVTALTMGGSDGTIDLVLLDEQNQQPVNLLPEVELDSANAGQWDDLLIEDLSPMPIILSADPVWSADISNAEDRGRAHQFAITAYYYDQATARYTGPVNFMTSRKYSGGEDVLELEKPNIMSMLKRVAVN